MAFLKKIVKSIKKRGRSVKKRSRRGSGISSLARSGGLGGKGRKTIKKRSKRGGLLGKSFRKFMRRKKGGIGSLSGRNKVPQGIGFSGKFEPQITPEMQQAAAMAAQSQFMRPQITPEMQQAATQMQQGMNQPAVAPNQGQAAALAAQSQFMSPQITPEMQQAQQQGMNQGTSIEGDYDPNKDPRAFQGMPAPSGLQDFMDQKIDPQQQGQFANLPPMEQLKYMQGMGGSQMGPRVPQPKPRRAVLYSQGMGGPQPFQMGSPSMMGPQRRQMPTGFRGGFRGMGPQRRQMPRGLQRAPSRGMMGMFGDGRFGGGGGMNR